jgi:hypothetical protein
MNLEKWSNVAWAVFTQHGSYNIELREATVKKMTNIGKIRKIRRILVGKT